MAWVVMMGSSDGLGCDDGEYIVMAWVVMMGSSDGLGCDDGE